MAANQSADGVTVETARGTTITIVGSKQDSDDVPKAGIFAWVTAQLAEIAAGTEKASIDADVKKHDITNQTQQNAVNQGVSLQKHTNSGNNALEIPGSSVLPKAY